ncbi:MAG: hypothetical protein K9K66_14935 [Desulfarculaceae bacterium]|nr:hypothetical protein [Desulfarculaceae bacterium]MCF8072488.1 hypothetical protein [Desulfarculaceae bacterium]MCF8102949.1 hypothetical protein [Desulfarculaceae bacterium]MCF8117029.1 hypothetical protein [Desulfarculaceae bacterium]
MTVTICASVSFKAEIKKTVETLQKSGIDARFPNLDIVIPDSGVTVELMQKLQNDHFKAIRESKIIYVLCLKKQNDKAEGYIGRAVGVEIGFAKGLGKEVIFSQKTMRPEADALADQFMDTNELVNYISVL